MLEYYINKGVGKSAEFKGLRAQYLYIFAGGLLGSFILFVILHTSGTPVMINVFIVLSLTGGLLFKVFGMNRKYGEWGLMKIGAQKREPRYMKNSGRIAERIRSGKKRSKK